MNYIVLPNELVQEYKYSNETVFIYCLLQKMLNYRSQIPFNLNWIYDELDISSDNTKKRKDIKKGLIKLKKDNYITFSSDLEKVNNNKIIFACIKEYKESFVQILDSEFDAIHGYVGLDIYKLFCIFANIKSRIDAKLYCYPSFEQIKLDTGISSNTSISKYLKVLKDELKLILYENVGIGVRGNKVTQLNNIYVMNYEGYDVVLKDAIEYRKNELAKYYEKIEKGKDINKKRSKSMVKHWKEIKKVNEFDFSEDNGELFVNDRGWDEFE